MQLLDGRLQGFDMYRSDLPNEVQVDVGLGMNQEVSQSRNLSPFNGRCLLANLLRQLLDRQPEDLQV